MPRRRAEKVFAAPEVAEGVFARLQASIDPQWIDEALEATGTATLRRRRLPAEQVIWLVLGMALFRDRRIDEVVAKLDLALPGPRGPSPAPSAVVQARARLGDEPMKWLAPAALKVIHPAATEPRGVPDSAFLVTFSLAASFASTGWRRRSPKLLPFVVMTVA